jgi:tetratricopeptide (TPR) repeat protein
VDSKFKSRADYFNLQAYNSYLDGDFRLFVANLRSALKINSSHVASALNLGSYYMKYGGYDKGGSYISKVYPSSDSKIPSVSMPDAINNYALYLVSKDEFNKAISSLKSIQQLDSNYVPSIANLAVLFKIIKKEKNADNPYFSQYKELAKSRADFDRIELMEKYK